SILVVIKLNFRKMEDPNKGRMGKFFQNAMDRAKQVVKDPQKMQELITSAKDKILKLRSENKDFDQFMLKIGTALRMLKAYKTKEYSELPWKSILMLTAGLIYFVMPLDLIPDFIPVLGLLDDASIMVWIFSSLRKDIEAFELWEHGNAQRI